MNEFSLTGKKILITGASSGIGRAAALLMAQYGADLFLTGRDRERLQETVSAIEAQALQAVAQRRPGAGHRAQGTAFPIGRCLMPNAQSIVADLTVAAEMDALIEKLPALNGIVHSAGIVGPLPVKFITQSDIDRMFSINYMVPVNLTGKLLRAKKISENSSILFLSTIATKNPYFGGALYSSSKAALEAYSKTLALEMVNRGIRSNCLQAGLVDTPMIVSPSEGNMQQEALERYLKRYPLGIGKPEDMASAILFFMSDASRWITGTSLILGGE